MSRVIFSACPNVDVLGIFHCQGIQLIWFLVGLGHVFAVGAGGGCLGFFIYPFSSSFSLSRRLFGID